MLILYLYAPWRECAPEALALLGAILEIRIGKQDPLRYFNKSVAGRDCTQDPCPLG